MSVKDTLKNLESRFPGRVGLGTEDEPRTEPERRAGDAREESHNSPAGWRKSGCALLDERFGGWPKGRLVELVGPASSGKLELLLSTLREGLGDSGDDDTPRAPAAALVDFSHLVHPSASWAGGRLLVVRPRGLTEGLQAVEVLLSSGSFSVIGVEATLLPPGRALPTASRLWNRLVQASQSTVIVCSLRPQVPAAALRLELHPEPSQLVVEVTRNRQGPPGRFVLERDTPTREFAWGRTPS